MIAYGGLANAQLNPELFANLYGGMSPNAGVENLAYSAQLDNLLFFSMQDNNNFKLYVTDGTTGNTQILKTLPQYLDLVAFDNHVYFSFEDPTNGVELWKTDGTLVGTVLVATLGGSSTGGAHYVVAGDKLFIASESAASTYNKRLYSLSIGSNTPLLLAANLNNVLSLTAYNNQVLFTANNPPNLYIEPYISDGTVAGTHILKDIRPGVDGSDPFGYFLYNDKMYFSANDGTHGFEVWSTDGTENGTQMLMDINPGNVHGVYSFYGAIADGILFFAANDGVHGTEIWTTYGIPGYTELLYDVNPTGSSNPLNFVALDNKIIFNANDGIHGSELWITNGTAQFTNMIKDINPGSDPSTFSIYQFNALCPNLLFFSSDDGVNGLEPWVTDGTAAGTFLIEDINAAGESVNALTRYVSFNEKIYFSAETETGRQLFVMDYNCEALGVEQRQATAFTIYPNPGKDIINIETTKEIANLKIYNTLGQVVNTAAGNKKEMDVSALSNGIYFLKISTIDNLQSIQRIIKE